MAGSGPEIRFLDAPVGEHVLRRADGDEISAREHGKAADHPAQSLDHMLDPQDGDAPASCTLRIVSIENVAFRLRQAAGDFVEQQEPRPQRQRLRQFQLLGVEQSELPGRNERAVGEPHPLQHPFGPLCLARGNAILPPCTAADQHVLEYESCG